MTRGNRAMSFTTKEYISFKKEIQSKLPPLKCSINPMSVSLEIIYPIPKSGSNKARLEKVGSYKSTSPDIDNVAKSILDAMSGCLYEDDKLITKLKLSKKYGDLEQKKIKIIVKYKIIDK
jgi:Holliday junction resolvase RusA-like endonuclease